MTNETKSADGTPKPLLTEAQQQRAASLHEARKVLESRRTGAPFAGTTSDVPDADEIICIAEFIYTGSIWLDDGVDSSGVKVEKEEREDS